VFSSTLPVILATLTPQEVDVDEDGEAVDFPPKTTVDKRERLWTSSGCSFNSGWMHTSHS